MAQKKHLLIIDDEMGTRESLKVIFCKDYRLSVVESGKDGFEVLQKDPPDCVLLDALLNDISGIDFLKDALRQYPNLQVIIVSAVSAVPNVVEAMQLGAFDYITKPFDVADIRRLVDRALENSSLKNQVEVLRSEITLEFPVDGVVGESKAFLDAMSEIKRAAKTEATVLITGESGTGKELATRSLHEMSNRKDEPFVPVHCAGMPETLIESELFGHEKGAFTSAIRQKQGRFDLAGSGTLFFDEVSEMSLNIQAKLLRVLEEREFVRVGGEKVIKTNVRIVAASNRDLKQLVGEGKFREDLFYRLSVVPIRLPSLRDRHGDIPLLAQFFLQHFTKLMQITSQGFAPETLRQLEAYNWPGNVRELRNIIERILVLHGNEPLILPEHLPPEFHQGDLPGAASLLRPGTTLADAVEAHERSLIVNALQETKGNQTKAAEILGTTRRILKYRMEKFAILSENFG